MHAETCTAGYTQILCFQVSANDVFATIEIRLTSAVWVPLEIPIAHSPAAAGTVERSLLMARSTVRFISETTPRYISLRHRSSFGNGIAPDRCTGRVPWVICAEMATSTLTPGLVIDFLQLFQFSTEDVVVIQDGRRTGRLAEN